MAAGNTPRPAPERLGRPPGVRLDPHLLRERRQRLGYTQEDVARLSGVSLRTVKGAEAGDRLAPMTARYITSALGLPYTGALRSAAEAVERSLHLAGYAPLPHRGPWVGRAGELPGLVEEIRSPRGGVWCLAGPPGVGKTALVRRAVAELADDFPDGVIWVQGTTLSRRQALVEVQIDLAEALGFDGQLPDPEHLASESWDCAFSTWLFSVRRLVVLDDVADVEAIASFRPARVPCWIVATMSRRAPLVPSDVHLLQVGPFPAADARTLLSTHAGAARLETEPAPTDALLELCRGLPRDLEAAGRRLASDRLLSVSGACEALCRGLLGEPALPDRLREGIRRLRVLGLAPFGVRWAEVATGLPEFETRQLLRDLIARYVLDEAAPGGEPNCPARFQLSARAAALGGPDDEPDLGHLERCLDLAGRELTPDLAFVAALHAELPQWRAMFDAATRATLRTPLGAPLCDLEALPAPARDVPSAASELLGDPVLLNLVRYCGPRSSSEWLGAALSLARARGDDSAVGSLAAAYGWWWYVNRGDLAVSTNWTRTAWRALQRAADPDAVPMGCHHALFARVHEGHASASLVLDEVLDDARSTASGWRGLVSALVVAACFRVQRGDPAQARSLLREAADLVPATSTREDRLCRAAVVVNLAVCDALEGSRVADARRVQDALSDLFALFFHHYPIPAFRLNLLCDALGVPPPWKPQCGSQVLSTVSASFGADHLAHLLPLLGDLGIRVPGASPDGAATPSPLGPLSPMGLTLANANTHTVALQLAVLTPVEGFRGLLRGSHARDALVAVDAITGPDHPVRRALADLAGLP